MTRFRLLGPLEVLRGGDVLSLPGGKPRALLARLLLDAGRVVTVEELVDSLWGAQAPPSAPKVLQVYVSQLRKALGADLIETRPPGYRLRASSDELDLGAFERLTESARADDDPRRRAQLLGEALELWRGPALAEFREEPFAAAAARRLAELRLSAVEERIDAELDLGEHAGLIAQLEALVEQEPLREQPRRQLMIALYRSGRQADALERYREGRRQLVDELGIEPGPALQELERAILRHDPALGEKELHSAPTRGCVVCEGLGLVELVAPLCADGRELILAEIVVDERELSQRSAELDRRRVELAAAGVQARTVCFTSSARGDDLARLAAEQEAELLVVSSDVAEQVPCDLALAARPDLELKPDGAVLVPFGGGREEWAALELGAWLARAHGLPLRLLGVEASEDRRDASRLLANASLALQRFAGTTAEPVLIPPAPEGILGQDGSVLVVPAGRGELDPTRKALVEQTAIPLLLVSPGLRPGGLAPERTLTRFSWSLSDA